MILFKYVAYYFRDARTGREPVKEYVDRLPEREQKKVLSYMRRLVDAGGYLDEPYAKHIKGDIRELRVDLARNRHRIFYFAVSGRRIILLHAFLKKTEKTPPRELAKAQRNHDVFLASE